METSSYMYVVVLPTLSVIAIKKVRFYHTIHLFSYFLCVTRRATGYAVAQAYGRSIEV